MRAIYCFDCLAANPRHYALSHGYRMISPRRNGAVPISTRSRSLETSIETRDRLHEVALGLIRSVFPPPKGIRLVGVALSSFRSQHGGEGPELPFSET